MIQSFKYSSYRSFYVAIGRAEISTNVILSKLEPKKTKATDIKTSINKLPIIGLTKGAVINLAECCNPLPGENIVGILVEGKGMTVHLLNCSTLDRFSDFPELWYELTWDNKGLKYPQFAKVNITLQNKIGSLHKVTSCIKKTNSNITIYSTLFFWSRTNCF